MQQGDDAPLIQSIDSSFLGDAPDKVAVAVSGGGDSMALLHVFIRWSAQTSVPVIAATVDHGLRAEAAAEAAFVAAFCARHGVPHTTLHWDGTQASGNVQAAARDARYRLMAEWALENGAAAVALGHTANDVAETFLMRLGRKSGLDGLAAMPSRFERNGVQWLRPLWQQTRAELRAYLRRHGVDWLEDPSNENLDQSRPKARKILEALAPLGIDVEGLRATAAALSVARSAVEAYAFEEASRVVQVDRGDVLIAQRPRPAVHPEVRRRLVRAALRFCNGAQYDPRESAMINLDAALAVQERHTVAGCLVIKDGEALRFTRELKATEGPLPWPNRSIGKIWDGRWLVSEQAGHSASGKLTIQALGEALSDVPDWREAGLPRASLMASPAIFKDETLISAPLAGFGAGFDARIVADYGSCLLSR